MPNHLGEALNIVLGVNANAARHVPALQTNGCFQNSGPVRNWPHASVGVDAKPAQRGHASDCLEEQTQLVVVNLVPKVIRQFNRANAITGGAS